MALTKLGAGAFVAGSVLQTVQTSDNTQTDLSSNGTYVNLSGLDTAITLKGANSSVLVFAQVYGGGHTGGAEGFAIQLYKGSSLITIGLGKGDGSSVGGTSGVHGCSPDNVGDDYAPTVITASILDTNASTAAGTTLTYKVYGRGFSGSNGWYYNYGGSNDGDNTGRWKPTSSVVLQEIKV